MDFRRREARCWRRVAALTAREFEILELLAARRGRRERIVPLARGTVLEIGVGPGVNFVHYDPAQVSKPYGLEVPGPKESWRSLSGRGVLASRSGRRISTDATALDA